VIQYKFDPNKKTFTLLKDYGDLGISYVRSSTRVNNLIIFGGYSYSFRVIDYEKMTIVGEKYDTAIDVITSLSICNVSPTQTLLSITGYSSTNYTNTQTDLLDITELLKEHSIDVKKVYNMENPRNHNSRKPIQKMINSSIGQKCICSSGKIMEVVITKMEHHICMVFEEYRRRVKANEKGKDEFDIGQNVLIF
jgi:hypothetical protein